MPKYMTKVIGLPDKLEDRKAITEGIKALIEAHGGEDLGGSVNNELTYIERLEAALTEEIGDMGVESLRQEFEASEKVL